MTEFAPVFLPDDKRLNGRARQTFLRHYAGCPRSAFLSQLYNGEAQTKEMIRGSALHRIAERATRLLMDMDEPMVPPDVVKVLVDETLADMHVPWEEHDFLRECAWRWASEFTADPNAIVALETLFSMTVGGFEVRARIDFAELLDNGTRLRVTDYKSSRAAPPYDEIARKTADGRLVPKQMQLILYALVLVHGHPVREEECARCDGRGTVVKDGPHDDEYDNRYPCPGCTTSRTALRGSGRVETVEPFSVASRAREFELEFVFPGIEDREGKMVRRPMVMNHLELEEYRSSLEGLVERVKRSEETGDWPAVVSDAACSICPAPGECPIPQEVRNWRGRINTPEQAAEAAMVLDRQKAELRAAQTELRNFAKETGEPIRFGGKLMELVYGESEEITDKDGLWAALARGEQVDRSQFVRVKGRTDFKSRDLTAEEIEREAQNG